MDQDNEIKRQELEAREGDREAREREQLHILKQNQALQTQQRQLLQVIMQQQQQLMVYLLSKK